MVKYPIINIGIKKQDKNDFCKLTTKNNKNKKFIKFDMKKTTIEYCNMDCQLALEIALKHLEQSSKPINGRDNFVGLCKTSASIALKTFKNCFLEDTIYGSPKNIQLLERMAFFGGRTGVNKPLSNDKLIYILDINSAHPASMCYNMPIQFLNIIKYPTPCRVKEFVPYHLFKAKSSYKGNNPNVIPNLLVKGREMSGSYLETDYNYHWGCELNEAVLLDFEITICEHIKYDDKIHKKGKPDKEGDIFKGYVEYMYNER